MRPGQQQNKQRMRGRGQRKGPNPMSRSFESNGPDVKIRGTAQHIADKYTTLARDAAAAGDRVMAENYLQHAEHYGRIVAAAMGQFQPSLPERDYSDFDEEDGEEGADLGQPYAGGQERPQTGFNGERPQNGERYQNGDRQGGDRQQGFRDNQNRGERRDNRGDRPFQNRDGQNRDGQTRDGQNREGFARDNRDHQNRDDRRDNRDNRQPGTGPQPFVQGPELDGEAGAPRAEGARFEGGRRESRRDRQRLNERSGERRFEERFGRQRPAGEERDEASAERQDRPVEPIAAVASEPGGEAPARVTVADTPVAETTQFPASEARGRGRRRREAGGEGEAPVPAPVAPEARVETPVPEATSESRHETPVSDAAPAPVRRRAAKAAPEVPAAAEDDAAPKRRVAKPRRKKEEGEAETDRAPALLTSDN